MPMSCAPSAPLISLTTWPEGFILRTTPLTRNANGKLIKRELRDQLLQSVSPAQN
jgi:hypothetical protein